MNKGPPYTSIPRDATKSVLRGQLRAKAIQSGMLPPAVRIDRKAPDSIMVEKAAIDAEMRLRSVTQEEQKDLTLHPDSLYDEEVAAFFLTQMGGQFPSVDELKAYKKPPQAPSKDSLLSRAATVKSERQKTLSALFDLQLMQTQRLDADRIMSEDLPHTKPETLEWFRKQHNHLQRRQTDTWSAVRELQRITELPIHHKLSGIASQVESDRQRLNSFLPTTRAEFDAMDDAPRYKVARWLTLNRPISARLPEWTPEAQNALWELFSHDDDFKAHVEEFVESKKTSDPRRR